MINSRVTTTRFELVLVVTIMIGLLVIIGMVMVGLVRLIEAFSRWFIQVV